MADIYVFGDSIGYGAWDERGGWVDRLKQDFHEQIISTFPLEPRIGRPEVYNLSIDGDKSADVASRIKAELTARRKPWSTLDDIVVIAIGTNDAYAEGSPGNFKYSARDYKRNLQKIYEDVTSLKLKLVFISLDPVDESRTNPVPWGSFYWTNQRIGEFNGILREFCQENKLKLIDLFDKLHSLPNFTELLSDGAHPNSKGHNWMYENIKPELVKLLEKQ